MRSPPSPTGLTPRTDEAQTLRRCGGRSFCTRARHRRCACSTGRQRPPVVTLTASSSPCRRLLSSTRATAPGGSSRACSKTYAARRSNPRPNCPNAAQTPKRHHHKLSAPSPNINRIERSPRPGFYTAPGTPPAPASNCSSPTARGQRHHGHQYHHTTIGSTDVTVGS